MGVAARTARARSRMMREPLYVCRRTTHAPAGRMQTPHKARAMHKRCCIFCQGPHAVLCAGVRLPAPLVCAACVSMCMHRLTLHYWHTSGFFSGYI